METLFSVLAPVATMVAAMMTAANISARVTGWGFVVFTVGSLAWCAVAIASGQQNLLITNGFLFLVNLVGVWRWLGRVAVHEDGARAAEVKSEHAAAPALIAVSNLVGRKVTDDTDEVIGGVIGVMAAYDDGKIAYIVVGVGGIAGVGQRLVAIDWSKVVTVDDHIRTSITGREISAAPDVDPKDWPVAATAD